MQIVQQELNQVANLTVAENILLGRIPNRFGVIQQRELDRRARIALDRFGLHDIASDTITGTLGVGRQQMIEIATPLDRDCKLLLLDEPTAALSRGETETLFTWLNQLRERGVGIIYVSHRLDEVARMADRITVLRDGKHVITCDTADVSTNEMIELMTGESKAEHGHRDHQSRASKHVALRVDGMSRGRFVRDVSFSVRRGERLGIAGLVGAGRTELLRLIFGADRADHGDIFLGDVPKPRRFCDPCEAVSAGLAMVTEDRKENGLLLSQSIQTDASLASMTKRFSTFGWIRNGDERRVASQMRDSMEIRSGGIGQRVSTLSGGNQQKVAIAKWLT